MSKSFDPAEHEEHPTLDQITDHYAHHGLQFIVAALKGCGCHMTVAIEALGKDDLENVIRGLGIVNAVSQAALSSIAALRGADAEAVFRDVGFKKIELSESDLKDLDD